MRLPSNKLSFCIRWRVLTILVETNIEIKIMSASHSRILTTDKKDVRLLLLFIFLFSIY